LNLKIDKGIYTKEDREVLSKIKLVDGLSEDVTMNNQTVFVRVGKRIPPAPKTLQEAKGPVTSDYQNYLEKQWLDELKAKYPVVVNKDVLYSIK
jgi:peptidyl-prolyl cis-trans isomerase SurA